MPKVLDKQINELVNEELSVNEVPNEKTISNLNILAMYERDLLEEHRCEVCSMHACSCFSEENEWKTT